MAQIQVCLRPVFGDIDLAVLVGAHSPRVHIDIGIQLLRRHLQPAGLEEPAQRSRCDSFSKSGDHSSGHKDIFCHDDPPFRNASDGMRCALAQARRPLSGLIAIG